MDPTQMTQADFDKLMTEEFGDRAVYDEEFRKKFANNPYANGIDLNIPDEYAQDYTKEYENLSQDENFDPLLMYILQKNAQTGFKNGPIGSDRYYESFDPELNPELDEDYQQFLDVFYPNM